MKPTAPIESLNPSDILTTLFTSKSGDPESMAPTQLSADLTPFAGQTVRLRIVAVAGRRVLNAGVDAVSIASTPPSNKFKKGKLKLNKSNGTGILTVTVPGAGVLSLTDAAATKKATASKKGRVEAGQAGHGEIEECGEGQGVGEADHGGGVGPERKGEAQDQGFAHLHADRRPRQQTGPQGHASVELEIGAGRIPAPPAGFCGQRCRAR